MAKKVLALGAGSVARPCVQYLLKKGHFVVSVDVVEKNVARVLNGHPNGTPLVSDAASNVAALIQEHKPDVVVCLLPSAFMVRTAKACIEAGVPMVGASYVKDEMRALDAFARERGVTILCEVGLDPGIDHMSAVEKIETLKAAGGVVEAFWSVCGAIPDLGSNTNPIGYKLSWAPSSLIGASKRSARIMIGGRQIDYLDGETYQHPSLVEIEGLGCFEVYANADSLPYIEGYGISGVKDIYRGTLRYPGWCELVSAMQKLRLFDEDTRDFAGRTHASLIREAIGASGAQKPLREQVAQYLALPVYSAVVEKLEWLGLFEETPTEPEKGSMMDVVSCRYAEKLQFSPGERDLVVMQHRYDVRFPQSGARKRITVTMAQTGSVEADTAIATTTGTPMGIAAHLILSGTVTEKGVLIPTTKEIYKPALAALAEEGVRFDEREEDLKA